MAHREATLNAWDAQLWLQIPVALAEVGSRLNAGNADYLGRLLELLEDAVALATALSLARLSAGRPLSDSLHRAAREQLERPSLGKRLALLWQIHAEHPGAAGWKLDAAAEGFDDLFALGRAGGPRRPRIRDVFDTLTTIRNDEAHRRLAHARREEVARAVEGAVFNLVRSNAGFSQRILFVEQVRRTPQGAYEITARSLHGPGATSYRRGHWQPVGAQQVLPQRVYLGNPDALVDDALVDAHPFLVCRGERLYVLDQLRSAGPVLRHFYSREALVELPGESLAAAWSARCEPPATMAAPAPPMPAPLALEARSPRGEAAPSIPGLRPGLPAWSAPLVAGAGVALVVASAVVGGVLYMLYVARPGAPPEPTSAVSAHPEPPRCRGSLPGSLPLFAQLPQILTGAPIQWGASATELEAVCSPVPLSPHAGECARRLVDMRSAPWPGGMVVPQRRDVTLAFHRERGLFEVMVFSEADPALLESTVAARLGPPHREQGNLRFWDYASGDSLVRVKVTPLPSTNTRGRSAIRAFHVASANEYGRELHALCPR